MGTAEPCSRRRALPFGSRLNGAAGNEKHFRMADEAATVIGCTRTGAETCQERHVKAIFAFVALLFVLHGPLLAADEVKQLAPTHAEVSYGPYPRNVLDFWKAD